MANYDDPQPPEIPVRPEAALAAAVIGLAIMDAQRKGGHTMRPADIRSARAFLAGGPALTFWCSVAGLVPDVVQKLAREAVAERIRPSHSHGPRAPRDVSKPFNTVELSA